MTYETLRHFADSWALLLMVATFVFLIGWAMRPGAKPHHDNAAKSIFDEDDHG